MIVLNWSLVLCGFIPLRLRKMFQHNLWFDLPRDKDVLFILSRHAKGITIRFFQYRKEYAMVPVLSQYKEFIN